MDEVSGLKLYSLGIVTVNKEPDSDWIAVTPCEHIGLQNGLISEQNKQYNVSGQDAKGIPQQFNVESESTLRAKWIPYAHSNRDTAPDVVKNETVLIFTYGDTNEYYWTTLFREPGLRRLERVCYMYGNLASGLLPYDKDSSYWLEVDTINKRVHLHTAMSDGERFEYDIVLDTGNSNLTVTDNAGNEIILDSLQNTLTINTNQSVQVNTQEATIQCDTAKIQAGSTAIIDTPETTVTGNLTIGGQLGVGSNGAGTGNTTIAGNITMVGSISVEGNIAASGSVTGSNID